MIVIGTVCAMTLIPTLLAVLTVVLPSGSWEASIAVVDDSSTIAETVTGRETGSLFFSPAHVPTPGKAFFECLDETALDEEDSTRVEDHGIASLTLLDCDPPLASGQLSPFLPASLHSQCAVITPILRC
jgi:hypothetical protein